MNQGSLQHEKQYAVYADEQMRVSHQEHQNLQALLYAQSTKVINVYDLFYTAYDCRTSAWLTCRESVYSGVPKSF